MSLLDKKAKMHEHASTQIDVPGGVAAKIISIGEQLIPQDYLAGEGRINTPHVTVKYGVIEDPEALRKAIAGQKPFTITLGKTVAFIPSEAGGGVVPIVVEAHAAQLGKLHSLVMQVMGETPDTMPYVPHITLAYVKPEEAQHFAGSDAFVGISFQATAITLSKHNDNDQVKVPLGQPPTEVDGVPVYAAAQPAVTPEIPENPNMLPETQQGPEEQPEPEVVQRDEPATEEEEPVDQETDVERRYREAEEARQKHPPQRTPKPERSVFPLPEESDPRDRRDDEPRKVVRSKAFKKWFGKSQVVDTEGKPLVVYHGTTHDITSFNMSKANVENHYGSGFYFTDSKLDVAANYATGVGPDVTNRIERRVDELQNEIWNVDPEELEEMLGEKASDEENIDELIKAKAREEILGEHGGATMPVYLSLQNPVIVEKNGGTHFNVEISDDGEESGNGVEMYNAIMNIAGGYNADAGDIWGRVAENMEFNAWDFEHVVRNGGETFEDDMGNSSPGQFIADVYQEMGFDGIIQDAYEAFGAKKQYGKPMYMDYDTKHYIVWDPTKIKSAIGNKAFDPSTSNITAAYENEFEEDYDETPQQWEEFYTIPSGTTLYHGTSNEWTEGDELNFPAWFSTYPAVANWFAHRNDEGTPVIRVYKTTSPIEVPVINDSQGIKDFCEMYNIEDYGVESLAEGVVNAGLNGWIIPNNYQPGDDIMLTDGGSLQFQSVGPAGAKTGAVQARVAADTGVDAMGTIQKIIAEMLPVLGGNLPKPEVKIVNSPRAGWYGRDTWRTWFRNGETGWSPTTEIEIQRSIIGDENTLRRVIAHELCHHKDALTNDLEDLKKMGFGAYRQLYRIRSGNGHGPNWREIASVFNAKYGKDFVTEKSDMNYVADLNLRPYYIMLWRSTTGNGKLYYAVTSRMTTKARKFITYHVGDPDYRITKTNDADFMNGQNIGSSWSYPKDDATDKKEKLEALWAQAPVSQWPQDVPAVPKPKPGDLTDEEKRQFVQNYRDAEQRNKENKTQWDKERAEAMRRVSPTASKTALVTDEARQTLQGIGSKLVEEKTIGDYDFFVTYDKNMGLHQIGMQRVGMNAVDLNQQYEKQQQNRGAGDRQELKQTIQSWLNKYHLLFIGSMNPEKTIKYIRILRAMGFDPQRRILGDLPFAFITDGTVKMGSVKFAGKRDNITTSLTLGVDSEKQDGFPSPVLIRWEQGMRWRQVLKSVKAIVNDIAGKRVAWRDIFIWSSLWEDYQTQQEGWESEKAKGTRVMYDVLHNGSFVSVGKQHLPYGQHVNMEPETEMVGADEACPKCGAPMSQHPDKESSHKTPPLSDTQYNNPEYGQETNAYADIPERVRGQYDVPSLQELVPEEFEKEGAELPDADVERSEEELAQIREEVKNIEYKPVEVVDSHRGELSCEVGAWLNGKPVGFVQFSEYGNVYAEGLQEGDDVPRAIHIKFVYVAPRYRRMGIGTGMYEQIKREFPGEPIEGSGTTQRGGLFRKKLKERGVLAYKSALLNKRAAYAEAQNQVQHTDHKAIGMYKTLKSDPFSEETELLHQSMNKQAANYEEMFKSVYNLTRDINGEGIHMEMPDRSILPDYKPNVTSEIAWAKKTLKKSDRITWWLRWYRLSLLEDVVSKLEKQSSDPVVKQREDEARKVMDAEEKAISKRTGRGISGTPHKSIGWFGTTHAVMQHFLSLPVAKIQNLVWDKQTPDEIGEQFKGYEKEWQEEIKGQVEIEEEDEPFIKFPDGWVWWKLSRAYCSEEARAMGHCGNVVGQDRPDERIISLRKPKTVGEQTMWEPHLTFILEPNNYLGEMKGKANQKPQPQYHKYIIALLEDPRIKGIRGGGYAPENNFAMKDLSPEQQEALMQKNPNLMPIARYIKEKGFTEDVKNRITDVLFPEDDNTALSDVSGDWSDDLQGWKTQGFNSIDDLVEEFGNEDAQYIKKQLGGDADMVDYDANWEDALNYLDTLHTAMIHKFIATEYPDEVAEWEEENDEEFTADVDDIKRVINDKGLDEVENNLRRAAEDAYRTGAEKEMYDALVSAVKDFEIEATGEIPHYPTYKDKASGKEGFVWDKPFSLYLPMATAAKLADAGDTFGAYGDQRSDSKVNATQPHYGWSNWDEDARDDAIEEDFSEPTPAQTKAQKYQEENQGKLFTPEEAEPEPEPQPVSPGLEPAEEGHHVVQRTSSLLRRKNHA